MNSVLRATPSRGFGLICHLACALGLFELEPPYFTGRSLLPASVNLFRPAAEAKSTVAVRSPPLPPKATTLPRPYSGARQPSPGGKYPGKIRRGPCSREIRCQERMALS